MNNFWAMMSYNMTIHLAQQVTYKNKSVKGTINFLVWIDNSYGGFIERGEIFPY